MPLLWFHQTTMHAYIYVCGFTRRQSSDAFASGETTKGKANIHLRLSKPQARLHLFFIKKDFNWAMK
jgi:hypothetical protein